MGKGIKFGTGGGMVVQNGVQEKWYAQTETIPSGTFVKQGTGNSYVYRNLIGANVTPDYIIPATPMMADNKFIVAYKVSNATQIGIALMQKSGDQIECLSHIDRAVDMGGAFNYNIAWKLHTISDNRVLLLAVYKTTNLFLYMYDIEVNGSEIGISQYPLFEVYDSTATNYIGVDFCVNDSEIVLGIQKSSKIHIVRLDYELNILSNNIANSKYVSVMSDYGFIQVDNNKYLAFLNDGYNSSYAFVIIKTNDVGEILESNVIDVSSTTGVNAYSYAGRLLCKLSANRFLFGGTSQYIVNIDGMQIGNVISCSKSGQYYAGVHVVDDSHFALMNYNYSSSYSTTKNYRVNSVTVSDNTVSNIECVNIGLNDGQKYDYYMTNVQYANSLLWSNEAEYIIPFQFSYRVNSSDDITKTKGDVVIARRTVDKTSATNIFGITKSKCKVDSPGKIWRAI